MVDAAVAERESASTSPNTSPDKAATGIGCCVGASGDVSGVVLLPPGLARSDEPIASGSDIMTLSDGCSNSDRLAPLASKSALASRAPDGHARLGTCEPPTRGVSLLVAAFDDPEATATMLEARSSANHSVPCCAPLEWMVAWLRQVRGLTLEKIARSSWLGDAATLLVAVNMILSASHPSLFQDAIQAHNLDRAPSVVD